MSDLRYYVHDYADEVCPCDCTLEGWAKWLSGPDAEWGRDAAAPDGIQFRAGVLRFEDDIVATRGDGGWTFSREPGDAGLLAFRFGPGLGWSADNVMADWESLKAALAGDPEFGFGPEDFEDVEYIAVGYDEPDVMLTYHAGETPKLTVSAVQ